MLIDIKNVGKVSNAHIEINGITVMGGVNNTGKSTIGKMLFCIVNSLYKFDEQVEQERNNRLFKIIKALIDGDAFPSSMKRNINHPENHESYLWFVPNVAFNKMTSNNMIYSKIFNDKTKIDKELRALLNRTDIDYGKNLSDADIKEATANISHIMEISDNSILTSVFLQMLQAEFNMQINNINKPDLESRVALEQNGNVAKVNIRENEHIEIEDGFSFENNAIYLDDPLILDNDPLILDRTIGQRNIENPKPHREHLLQFLYKNSKNAPIAIAFDEALAKKKLDGVLSKLDSVCNGELVSTPKTRDAMIAYRAFGSATELDIKNVSTGIKTFALLKRLLFNGSLKENGIMILDEPEIHLHPEWQLVFAEIIVLLHKEYNIRFLLNTHSPYFLDAITVFSEKHGITKKCKYYLAEDTEGFASTTDVTDNIEKLFEKLAMPLQTLENERYKDD